MRAGQACQSGNYFAAGGNVGSVSGVFVSAGVLWVNVSNQNFAEADTYSSKLLWLLWTGNFKTQRGRKMTECSGLWCWNWHIITCVAASPHRFDTDRRCIKWNQILILGVTLNSKSLINAGSISGILSRSACPIKELHFLNYITGQMKNHLQLF